MKIIHDDEYRRELERLGVNLLSGEGCNLGLRVDTDVSPKAAFYIEGYLGVELQGGTFNGWSVDPDGKYHAGYSKSWDYVNKCHIPFWTTEVGYGMKMPRSLIEELLVYMLLAIDSYEMVVWVHSKRVLLEGFFISGRVICFDSIEEYRKFRELMDNDTAFAEIDDPMAREACALARQAERWDVRWRSFRKEDVPANRHAFFGRKIGL